MESRSPGYASERSRASIRRFRGRFCLTSALAAALIVAPTAATAASPADFASVVARYGLRPIDPAVPSPGFKLPDLAGGERSELDFAGRWVVLTFWATWCGPCRAEMPSLERLHQMRYGSGLAVVGVSVDRTVAPAEQFVQEYGLTFPNLWDARGRAADDFRAQSIPLSYLIDPAGRVIGVSLGARDWTALEPMIDELMQLEPPGEAAAGEHETTGGALELPDALEPPSAEIVVVDERPEVGKPFAVEVKVRWAGHFGDYLPHPPRIELPEQVEQAAITASSRSSEGRNVVAYRVDLRAHEAGTFALDPVELLYTPRGETEPLALRVAGPTVEVAEATLLGLRHGSWLAAAAGFAALLVAAAAVGRWRHRREPDSGDDDPRVYEELRGRLDAARSRRLEGDLRGATLILAEIEAELGVDGDAERAALDRLIEGARYGGYSPSREELDGMERRVARRVTELEGDPGQAARRALRLRSQEG